MSVRERSICRRCHRVRPVNETRYCAPCIEELRRAEQRYGARCPHCAESGIRATLQPAVTARGDVQRCWQCGGEYVGGERVWPREGSGDALLPEDARSSGSDAESVAPSDPVE